MVNAPFKGIVRLFKYKVLHLVWIIFHIKLSVAVNISYALLNMDHTLGQIFHEKWDLIYKKVYIKGIYEGVVLKQLNYPFSMLPIIIRSVDRILNDN